MSKFVKLSQIADLTVGFVGTMAKHYTDTGVPFLRSLNIKPFKIVADDMKYVSPEFSKTISKSILHENDIVIVRTGIPGTCSVVSKEYDGCNCSDVVIVHPDLELVDPTYLAAYINVWGQRQISNNKVGAIQQHFNVHSADEMLIYLPDISIQRDVAEVITTLNKKIETNEAIGNELESMAKMLYDYWFVQFDFLDANGKPYRASGGEMVWNEQLKREIPKGWIVQPLSYYLDCNKHTIKRNEWKYDIEYLDTGSLTSNRIGELQRYETIEAAPSRAQRIVHPNDILYSTVRPNQCHYGLIKTPFPNLVASSGFACLASKFGAEYNDLFYAFLSSTRIVERLTSIAASSVSAYPSIKPNDIMELLIALPERLETIRTMSDRLCELFSAVAHYQAENRELSQLRDWLLPMLMNGQATVAPAESPTKLQVLQPEKPARDPRFDRWLQTQGVAARGTVDEQTLHDIFDAMDDDDKQ